jgi:hypothetical protein
VVKTPVHECLESVRVGVGNSPGLRPIKEDCLLIGIEDSDRVLKRRCTEFPTESQGVECMPDSVNAALYVIICSTAFANHAPKIREAVCFCDVFSVEL